jgi:hypothetical protein
MAPGLVVLDFVEGRCQDRRPTGRLKPPDHFFYAPRKLAVRFPERSSPSGKWPVAAVAWDGRALDCFLGHRRSQDI